MYLAVSTSILLFMSVIWRRENLWNLLFKLVLIGAAAWGFVLTLAAFGWITHLSR
jgi:hypothetical protein